jgi:hypothetical protein
VMKTTKKHCKIARAGKRFLHALSNFHRCGACVEVIADSDSGSELCGCGRCGHGGMVAAEAREVRGQRTEVSKKWLSGGASPALRWDVERCAVFRLIAMIAVVSWKIHRTPACIVYYTDGHRTARRR